MTLIQRVKASNGTSHARHISAADSPDRSPLTASMIHSGHDRSRQAEMNDGSSPHRVKRYRRLDASGLLRPRNGDQFAAGTQRRVDSASRRQGAGPVAVFDLAQVADIEWRQFGQAPQGNAAFGAQTPYCLTEALVAGHSHDCPDSVACVVKVPLPTGNTYRDASDPERLRPVAPGRVLARIVGARYSRQGCLRHERRPPRCPPGEVSG